MKFVRLLLVLGVLLGLAPTVAPAQIGDPPLPFTTDPTARPRLLLTEQYLAETLRPRWEQGASSAQRWRAYIESDAPEQDFPAHPAAATRALALGYLVTGEARYAERAQVGLLQMVDAIASHPSMTGSAYWDADFLETVAGVAVAFDWLYDTLLPTDRDALVTVMLDAAAMLNNPERGFDLAYILSEDGGFYRFAAYDVWGPRVLWAVAATGLALLGDDPAAAELVEYARDLLRGWMLPALDDLQGGAWPAGPAPAFRATWALAQTATAFWTARGENYFSATDWWYDRLAYNLFFYLPNHQTSPAGPHPGYADIIGPGERHNPAGVLARAHDSLLTTVFAGTQYAAWMGWFLGEVSPPLQGPWTAEEFLWDAGGTGDTPPPWLVWYTLGTGHAFMRSAWEGEDITHISFIAGDRYAADQFLASGHLALWRGDDLLLGRGGAYSGEILHDANYYGRSIAANVPLICDLAEDFDAARPAPPDTLWLNDCGQRGAAGQRPTNPYYRAENAPAFETGGILRFAEEGGLVYFRADLTAAYNSPLYTTPGNRPKAQNVLREVIFIRPDVLLVHDRVTTSDPDAALINSFHVPAQPAALGEWWRIDNGDSHLFWRDLAPGNQVQISEAYDVAGQSVPPAGQVAAPYHIRSIPAERTAHQPFLTLMIVGGAQPPIAQPMQGDGVYGVAFGSWQVLFDDDPQNISTATAEILPGVSDVLVVGLAPLGEYRAELPDGTRRTVQADDAGTLYFFTGTAGRLRLSSR